MKSHIMHEISDNHADLLARSRRISRELRKRRLKQESAIKPQESSLDRPDIYWDHAPTGTYPIIAFRTIPCDKYIKGNCGPCSYSARSYPAGLSSKTIYSSLMDQLEWVLGNFEELFVKRSNGELEGYQLRQAPDRPWYMMQLAGESSFFRDAEIPPEYRRKILGRLIEFQEEQKINLHVMLECRAEHLLAANDSGELEALEPFLRGLDAVVNVGYESHDEFLRNVAFDKDLRAMAFERAMRVAKERKLDPGVFIFAGTTFQTTSEILQGLSRDLGYLQSMGLFANVMVPNLQAYTLPDLLHEFGEYRLPEPYFLLDVADCLLTFRPVRNHPVTPFDWFIGGIESDPPPRLNILTNPSRQTSVEVTTQIHECLLRLVRNLDADEYRRETARLRAKPDYIFHSEGLAIKDGRPWQERLEANLAFAESHLEVYDSQIHFGLDTSEQRSALQ